MVNLFGYCDRENEDENSIAEYVWNKLKEHFLNEDFEKWHIVEKEKCLNRKDFLLELDINVKLKNV